MGLLFHCRSVAYAVGLYNIYTLEYWWEGRERKYKICFEDNISTRYVIVCPFSVDIVCSPDLVAPVTRFLLSHIYYKYRESIVIVKKLEFEISMELSVLRTPDSKKVVFTKCLYICLYVCLYVCLSVCMSVSRATAKTTGSIFINFGIFMSIGLYTCTRRDFEIFQK